MLIAELLGKFQVQLDNLPVEIASRPAQSLLAYLLIHSGIQHRREKLAGLFWPDAAEENARRSLRQALWQIRKGFRQVEADYLDSDDIAIVFHLGDGDQVDVLAFNRSLPPDASAEAIIAVVAWYRGELLPGFYDNWAVLERERLQVDFEQKMNKLLERLVAECRWEDALAWGERWIDQGAALEPAYRALMIAHHALGNQSAVAVTFQRCASALERELGIEPDEQTRQLYQALLKDARPGPSYAGLPRELAVNAPPVAVSADQPAQREGPPPFKGLLPFDEEDSAIFFGREQLTGELLQRIEGLPEGARLLAVIGASGSGKSSLVRAGLIPALRKPAGHAANIYLATPTAHPLETLAASLTQSSESVSAMATLVDDMLQDPRSLNLFLIKSRAPGRPDGTLLIIDQFEEVFTQCRDESERQAFIDNLLAAAAGERAKVVLTLRADFYAACAAYPKLRQLLAANQEYIGAMSTSELRSAIERPASSAGWLFEAGLVDLILRDIGVLSGVGTKTAYQVEPGALPLLSHALLETWKRRQGSTLTLAGYAEAGGVRGAIARTAENTYSHLSPAEQHWARNIFLRLTELGDDSLDGFNPPDTRRRVALDELIPDGEDGAAARRVLDILTSARLVTAGEGIVEVAHEALIREWPALRSWLAEDREGLRLHRRLTEAAQAWEALDCTSEELYRGARLAQAAEWAQAHPGALNALEQNFLIASHTWAEQEAAEQEASRQRSLETAQKLAESESKRARQQAAANVMLRLLATGLGIFSLAAAVLGAFFFQQRNRAETQSHLAASRELAASAVANLDIDPERSILLSLQALRTADTLEAEDALHQAIQRSRLRRTFPLQSLSGLRAVFSPDGRRVAASSAGPQAGLATEIFDAASGKRLLTLPGMLAATIWPESGHLATLAAGQGDAALLRTWDAASGRLLSSVILGHTFKDSVSGDIDPAWQLIAENLADGTTLVSDLSTGKPLYRLGLSGAASYSAGIAFSPDGARLATSVGGVTQVFAAATGKELFQLPSIDYGAGAIAFSPDARRIAVALGPSVVIADASGGKVQFTLTGHTGLVSSIHFSADGKYIAAGASDSTTIVWDAASGQALMTLAGPTASVQNVQFSPDGTNLLTISGDQKARLWDVSLSGSREDLAWYDRSAQAFSGVAFSPDGAHLAAVGGGIIGYTWDMTSGATLLRLDGKGGYQGAVAFSPNGRMLATTSGSELVDIRDATTGTIIRSLYGHSLWVGGMAFSPDGSRLATIGYDNTAVVWDVASGKQLFSIDAYNQFAPYSQEIGVAFSPDGRQFATAGMERVRIWDAATGKMLRELPAQPAEAYQVAYNPDGRSLVVGYALGMGAIVWDAQSGALMHVLTGQHGSIQGLVFSRDGRQIITGSVDGTIKIWDAASGAEQLTLGRQPGQITGLALNPDGSRLAAASTDGTVRVYVLRIQDLEQLARIRLTRSLTLEECQKYLHVSACPAQ
jgi:WD40 repeat protein/DNA-binding SARP family transcriptional activator